MSATVGGNKLSNFAGNISRGMLKSDWNVMRRIIEEFNSKYVLQNEYNSLNRKFIDSSGRHSFLLTEI